MRLIVVGSPGVVDSDAFDQNGPIWTNAEEYNRQTLRRLAQIAREVAAQEGVRYADVHGFLARDGEGKGEVWASLPCRRCRRRAPAANGHLIIAYAFLKALGCDGNIGTFTVDLAARRVTVSEGHRLLSFADDSVKIRVHPLSILFLWRTDRSGEHAWNSRGAPFNAELNRLELWVTGASTPRLKVTWEAVQNFPRGGIGERGKPGRRVPGQPVQRALPIGRICRSKQQQCGAPRVHIIEESWAEDGANKRQCAVHRVWRRSWNWKLLRATPLSPLHTLTITPVP